MEEEWYEERGGERALKPEYAPAGPAGKAKRKK